MTGPEIALKPCPLCRGKAGIERPGTARQSCIIVCDNCGLRLETNEVWNMGARWNTRTPASPSDEQVRFALSDIAANSDDPIAVAAACRALGHILSQNLGEPDA